LKFYTIYINKYIYICIYIIANIEQQLKLDPVLFTHYKYYVREMRIISYAQLLESYRSVTIESMASSFGVSEKFIDEYVLFYFVFIKKKYIIITIIIIIIMIF